jgi:hypothetical protein
MNLLLHTAANQTIVEFSADSLLLQNEQDTIFIMEELFPSRARKIILHRENIHPDFFQLRTGLAGAILQKFVNYHIQVAIVGDFTTITSDALKAFMYESNRGGQIYFVENVETALQILSKLRGDNP